MHGQSSKSTRANKPCDHLYLVPCCATETSAFFCPHHSRMPLLPSTLANTRKQNPRNSSRNMLPPELVDWSFLMSHEYAACALIELMQIGKAPSGTDLSFITRQKPSMGLRWCPHRAGTYDDGFGGTLTLKPANGDTYAFHIEVVRGPTYHTGDVEGDVHLQTGHRHVCTGSGLWRGNAMLPSYVHTRTHVHRRRGG